MQMQQQHIFYEILQGGMTDEDLEKFSLSDYTAEDFRITSCSGTYDRRDGVEDAETYQDLTDAMDTVGFTDTEQTDILTVICALLHASNLTMNALSADECEINKENVHLDVFLSLMGFTPKALNQALCYFSIKAGKESHTRSLPKLKAEKGLEAFVKAVYGALFDLIVQRINSSITAKSDGKKRGGSQVDKSIAATIAVLDIFGFESFKTNSFEQLCINYCNEALQQQFNLFVLKNEQEEYEREGIAWSFIEFPENQDVLDLIGKKGSGVSQQRKTYFPSRIEFLFSHHFLSSFFTKNNKTIFGIAIRSYPSSMINVVLLEQQIRHLQMTSTTSARGTPDLRPISVRSGRYALAFSTMLGQSSTTRLDLSKRIEMIFPRRPRSCCFLRPTSSSRP